MKDVPIPDFSDLNPARYYQMTIEGARSCPFQCSFCSETIQWGEYRKKPIELFTEQVVELAEKYNNNEFFMGDSLMNPYIGQFAKSLLERKTAILYDGYLRADKPVTHRDRLEIWARSGLYRVRLGIESASGRVLESMDKMTTPQVISDALKALANTGIRTTTYWIVGFQDETEEEFEETCDFIRKNHRYIYELEAHPYAYYPYGQVGSRLHESYSLYPDDITAVIKFRVWDVKDANPTRDEKFDRLRRISSLASELGIPNIYTMADRYKAEARWHLLHPLAVEVHEGTRPQRGEIHLPERRIPAFSQEWVRTSAQETPHADSTLCYQVAVNNKLDETKLSASIKQLFRFNEMLQVRLEEDGEYLPTSVEDAHLRDKMLSVYYVEEPEDKLEATKSQIIESLSADMLPEPRASVRVALIVHKDESCELLFLVHQAIADSQSVILLLEDLFRIYEQLSHEKEISLRPAQKTYLDFIDNPTIDCSRITNDSGLTARVRSRVAPVVSVQFDEKIASRMFSVILAEYGRVKPIEVFATAVLKSLAILGKSTDVDVDITYDYRLLDTSLEHTVGVLTRTRQLPPEVVRNVPSLKETQSVLASLGNLEAVPSDENAAKKERVLLNLKYLTGEPWLGGGEWTPQGFLFNERWLNEKYQFEIAPVLSKSSFAVCFKYQAKRETKEFVNLLAAQLTREVELLLEYCEHYVAAKKFWLNEFRLSVPKPNLEIDSGDLTTTDARMGSVSCAVERSLLAKIQSESKADVSLVILAAYAVLLSRLNGREELVIVTCLSRAETMNLAPLRLYPSWNLSFAEFVGEIVRKSRLAFEHEADAFEILANVLPKSEHAASCPIFDVGYIFKQSAEAGEIIGAINELLKRDTASRAGLGLTLEVARRDGNLNLEFVYERSRFALPVIEKLASYMGRILEAVSKNANVHLGDVALESDLKNYQAIEALSNVAFNF